MLIYDMGNIPKPQVTILNLKKAYIEQLGQGTVDTLTIKPNQYMQDRLTKHRSSTFQTSRTPAIAVNITK